MLLLQYDTLYQLDSNGVPQPWLGEITAISADGLSVTVTLRAGVTWHDGEPFTAEDVVFTVDYFKQFTQSRFTRALRPVEAAAVTGDNEVTFTLTARTPALELGVFSDVPVLPEHVWTGVDPTVEGTPDISLNIGTGPYQLVEYVAEEFYRFTAFPDYWAGTPAANELVFISYANISGALAALQSNEVDMLVGSVPPEQGDFLALSSDIAITQGPLFTSEMINYDMTLPPFDQPAVRQALALAMNRQDLIDTIYLGQGTIGSAGWLHPQSAYFNSAITSDYDAAAANALLDEAGITDSDGDGVREFEGAPLTYDLLVPSNNALRVRLAELVREMLAAIGFNINVAVVEQATWEEAVWPGFDVRNGRSYALSMWGWSAPIQADPFRIASLVHSDPAIGSLNLTGYANPTMDALLDELLVTTDTPRQQELLNEIQQLIADELPFVMLLYPDAVYAYRPAVYDGWTFMTGQGIFHKLSLLPADAQP